MGEGLSGQISKEKIELKEMKQRMNQGEDEEKDNNMGVFGKLFSLNKLVFKFAIFAGGLVAGRISLRLVYALETIYPVFLMTFVLLYFKEDKVKHHHLRDFG